VLSAVYHINNVAVVLIADWKEENIHRESKKGATLSMAITLSILGGFAKFFSLLQRAVNFQQNQRLPPYLKYVAALP